MISIPQLIERTIDSFLKEININSFITSVTEIELGKETYFNISFWNLITDSPCENENQIFISKSDIDKLTNLDSDLLKLCHRAIHPILQEACMEIIRRKNETTK
jgi:hypothetical protein